MPKYANGSDAYVISDRSGFRYRTKDTRKEWNGLLVGKDEYEEKHPQLDPRPKKPDAEASVSYTHLTLPTTPYV